jgi:DNA-binding transcriptional MocR family regulator
MIKSPFLVQLDPSCRESIRTQLVNKISELINNEVVKVDSALPSTRILAQQLGISRSTVSLAYEELQILGYLKTRQGSYHYVQKRRKEAKYHVERESLISWDKASSETAEQLFHNYQRNLADIQTRFDSPNSSVINFSEFKLEPELFPLEDIRRSVSHVLSAHGKESMDASPPRGNVFLREYIAWRSRLHGISATAEEILITNGSQQALDLIIRLLTKPGKAAVIEAPTYFNIIPLLRFSPLRVLAIPMKRDGMDLRALERVSKKEEISFVYTIPNFHNPMGITTSHQHREKLLDICMKKRIPIIEDAFDEEMKYFGKLPLPIKSIDENNMVIYVGTFSKILFPGLRIGWVIADKACIERLTALKRVSDLRCSTLDQYVIHHFCSEGFYDRHLRKLLRIFRKRMTMTLALMQEHFPSGASWTHPSGGFTVWVKMNKSFRAQDLNNHMLKYGVIVSPGEYYFHNRTHSECFRIAIARTSSDQAKEGIIRLGKALQGLLSSNRK